MKTGAGTLAEYAVVEPDLLAHKPNTISHAEAAAFPLAGLTSYAALVRTGGLKRGAGQRVFIVRAADSRTLQAQAHIFFSLHRTAEAVVWEPGQSR